MSLLLVSVLCSNNLSSIVAQCVSDIHLSKGKGPDNNYCVLFCKKKKNERKKTRIRYEMN